MNFPFSLGDILERIIPGSIFLFGVLLLFDPSYFDGVKMAVAIQNVSAVSFSVLISISYALGVLFNISAISIKSADKKYMVLNEDDEKSGLKMIKIKEAFEDIFGLDWNEEAWRLCYGVAHKSKFSPNIELFAKLNVFCRSMMMSTASLFAVSLFVLIHNIIVKSSLLLITAFSVITAISCLVFLRGAKLYSRSFSSAIYEAFFTWYISRELKQDLPEED